MKTNIYIDGANLHQSSAHLGFRIDYMKLRGWLRQKFGADTIYIFLGFIAEYSKLYGYLQRCGYVLIFKETVTNAIGQTKGNCDAEMVLRAVSDYYEKYFDICVIVSGDGDFSCLVKFFMERRVLDSIVVPSKKSSSYLLRKLRPRIVSLEDHYGKFSIKVSFARE